MMRWRAYMMRGTLMRMCVDFLLVGFESPVGNPVVKERDEKHREEGGRKHAADHTSSYGVARASTRAGGNGQRQNAENKRE